MVSGESEPRVRSGIVWVPWSMDVGVCVCAWLLEAVEILDYNLFECFPTLEVPRRRGPTNLNG